VYKPFRGNDKFLSIIFIFVFISVIIVKTSAKVTQDNLYDTKLKAYEYMEEYMKVIRDYKYELGIDIADEDIHKTGMIGEYYSGITTSLGKIEAKRTSANPDMAALVVELLYKAGVKSGDRIGANFSGSFPALNLAVLAASKAMNLDCVYISSVGSSNYGANNPKLTFPDMVLKLTEEGLLDNPGVAFSLGGKDDLGLEMDESIKEEIINRLEAKGLRLILPKDYNHDINQRMRLLEENGDLKCFVNVGGNVISLGNSENSFYFGQGLLVGKSVPITKDSGLIEIYMNKGIPVIHLLNLKKLTVDYNLEYDPLILPNKGTSALFVELSYNKIICIVSLIISVLGLIFYKRKYVRMTY